jgi:anti-sigma-K factor RsiG
MDAFPDLATLDDAGLKRLIDELQAEETEVSFQRRMLQGRIDILSSGATDLESLTAALSGKATGAELSPEQQRELEALQAEENDISMRRRLLHGRIDLLRTELVVRLQRSHGQSVLSEVDMNALTDILAGKSAPAE